MVHTAAALALFLAWQGNPYDDGMKALDEKRYEAAVENFTRAIAADGSDYTSHFNLALAYSLLKKDSEAVTEYRKTLELKPGVYQAQLNLGMLLIRDRQTAEAETVLAAAVAQRPLEFRPIYYLAEAQLADASYAEAEKSYLAALTIDAKSAAAELGLAHAIAKQNRLPDAVPHFEKAAELDPKYNDGLLELAGLYEDAKDYAKAGELYAKFPDNPAAQEHRAAMLLAAGQASAAVKQFEAAVAQSPTEGNRLALVDAYLVNKQPEKALPLIEQLLQAKPADYNLIVNHARVLRNMRKFNPAIQEFFKAAQMKPDEPENWSELAVLLVLQDDYGRALGALDRVRALHAEKPGHIYLRAIVLDKVHQIKPALATYKEFLAASEGKNPDEEFKARQRVRILENQLNRR
jgi:tetratricopeptide (TPR) repeat protein